MRTTSDGVPIADLVGAVKAAIVVVGMSASRSERDLKVTAVQLTLNTIATEKAGGKLEFKVPVLGMAVKLRRSVTTKNTHTVELTLVPPDLAPAHEARGHEVEEVWSRRSRPCGTSWPRQRTATSRSCSRTARWN